MENTIVYDLLISQNRCIGVKGKDKDGMLFKILPIMWSLRQVVLGQIYSFTSSAETVTGTGLLLRTVQEPN